MDVDEALTEWSCPSCGAVTRARMADAGPAEVDRLRGALRDLVAHWDDEARTLPAVTDDTWATEGERLGLASRAIRARIRALDLS